MSKPTVQITNTKPNVNISGEVSVNLPVVWDSILYSWDMVGLNWDSTFQQVIKGKPVVNITQ